MLAFFLLGLGRYHLAAQLTTTLSLQTLLCFLATAISRRMRTTMKVEVYDTATQRKAAIILVAITAAEGFWLFVNANHNLSRFLHYTGFIGASANLWGWLSALLCAILFTGYSARLPSVRANLIRLSWLKLLALTVGITAGFCEESIFRKLLMDSLQNRGCGLAVQLVASAAAFGLAHGVWGLFRGSIFLRIILVTGVMGLALAAVYIIGHRVVAPCIVAHFLINLFAEPGLVLSALRGEMSSHPE